MKSLRPDSEFPCLLITDSGNQSSLKMQVRGYINRHTDTASPADRQIARDLYEVLRGDSNLIFANSRQRTEHFAVLLSDLCDENSVPKEFFPHHGSLSKEIREFLEQRLQKETLPTTAVCTMTLELGIDIGKVKSVAQVTAPHSVSSMRQRLGRSGRRDDPAILRMFITERELDVNSNIVDKLRMELLQSVAMIRLLVNEKWYEPADDKLFHFSTLLHQVLAIIAQWGGVRANQLWSLLCKSGTFGNVTIEHFKVLLSDMGKKRLISQLSSGELVLADEGEKLVNHYSFYAVFKTPVEYRIVIEKGRKTIGSLPIDSFVLPEQHIVFGGKRWRIKDIDTEKKVIYVVPTKGGSPPNFAGDGMSVHDRVRQEMLKIYLDGDYRIDVKGTKLEFMNANAKELFLEGLSFFRDAGLKHKRLISHGQHTFLIPWMGDKIVNTLAVLLNSTGYKTRRFAGVIEIENPNSVDISDHLKVFSKQSGVSNVGLSKFVKNKEVEKYDHLLPESLLNEGYGAKAFDVDGTIDWIRKADHLNYL